LRDEFTRFSQIWRLQFFGEPGVDWQQQTTARPPRCIHKRASAMEAHNSKSFACCCRASQIASVNSAATSKSPEVLLASNSSPSSLRRGEPSKEENPRGSSFLEAIHPTSQQFGSAHQRAQQFKRALIGPISARVHGSRTSYRSGVGSRRRSPRYLGRQAIAVAQQDSASHQPPSAGANLRNDQRADDHVASSDSDAHLQVFAANRRLVDRGSHCKSRRTARSASASRDSGQPKWISTPSPT
jgi:hypothetical protein